ncbi:MAG: hypothetical protein FJ191_08925 [Gammaproteobacteria bacterium]|nr:hypothetical protein [Gammaproteobacteria bacterium]
MDLRRILRHVAHTRFATRRAFPAPALAALGRAVTAGERRHAGEVRCVVEGELDWDALLAGQTARERALEVFALERVWDTAANSGVLIYLLLADRDVEIVADRGYNGRVAPAEWQAVCAEMERRFRAGDFAAGTVAGIESVHRLAEREFPASGAGVNELSDQPRQR